MALMPGMDQPHLLIVGHRCRPKHVRIAHQREHRVGALGSKGLRQDIRNLVVAHPASLFPAKTWRSHDRRARQKSLPPLNSAAAGRGKAAPGAACRLAPSGICRRRTVVAPAPSFSAARGAATTSVAALAGARCATSLATLSANSVRIARARCTPPAFAKVSSGPVTVKLPSTFSNVVAL